MPMKNSSNASIVDDGRGNFSPPSILPVNLEIRGFIFLFVFAAAVRCPRLRRPNNGEVYPPSCSRGRSRFGARCAVACRPGFQMQPEGPTIRECAHPGAWTGSNIAPRCVGQ